MDREAFLSLILSIYLLIPPDFAVTESLHHYTLLQKLSYKESFGFDFYQYPYKCVFEFCSSA